LGACTEPTRVTFLGVDRDPVAIEGARARFAHLRCYSEEVDVIRWNPRLVRIAVALGAFASLAIASGAGTRWG